MDLTLESRETKNMMSYLVLKIIGITLLFVSQMITLAYVYSSYYSGYNLDAWMQVVGVFSQIGLPLVLISTLTSIMINKKRIFWYIGAYALGAICFVFIEQLAIMIYLRFLTSQMTFTLSPALLSWIKDLLITLLNKFVSLNVFVDLLLVSLFYLFLFYKPKKHVALFRCFIIIPAAYLITSYILSVLNKLGIVYLNFYVSSFLASKKPSAYVIFLSMLLYLKVKNLKHEELKSSSRDFQVFISLVILAVSVIDGFLGLLSNASKFSVGNNYCLFLCIPFIFLFDYKKKVKHKWLGLSIPVYYTLGYGVLMYFYTLLLIEVLNLLGGIIAPTLGLK